MLRYTVVILLCLVALVRAHDPKSVPSSEELEQLRAAGKLSDALLRLKWHGEHEINAGIDNSAYYRLERDRLKAVGKSESEIANAIYGDGPLAAFPFTGRQPELRSTGSRRTLTILIDFKDYRQEDVLPGLSADVIDASIYAEATPARSALYSPYESVRAYYDRASEGRFELQGDVLGWYSFEDNREEYEPQEVVRTPGMTDGQFNTLKFIREQEALYELATTALDKFESDGHDFTQYDNDNDGDIDSLTILYAGPRGSWSSFWWAYQWSFQLSTFNKTYDGKALNQFVFQFVDTRGRNNDDFDPQTLIHETGHALGLPDYYDYDAGLRASERQGPDGGVGGLDIMDANWGNHNAFSRWLLDWVDPKVIESGAPAVQTLVASTDQGVGEKALALFPGLDPTSNSPGTDMYLLEYRRRTGNDGGVNQIPADGLLLWRIDGTPNIAGNGFRFNNSDSPKKLIRLVRNGSSDDFGNRQTATASDFFTAGDDFTPFSSPGSGSTLLSITEIQLNNETASAKVGYVSSAEMDRRREDLLANSPLLVEAREILESAKVESIRLGRIEKLGRLAADATPEELAATWRILEDGDHLKVRELQITAQNLILHWSSKDGLGAARAALDLERRLVLSTTGEQPATHPLYERVMSNWAITRPREATAWVGTPQQHMPDPGGDFADSVVTYLQKARPSELRELANLPRSGFQETTAKAAIDRLRTIDGSARIKFPIDPSHPNHGHHEAHEVESWLDLDPGPLVPVNGLLPRGNSLGAADYGALTGPGALNVVSYNLESGDANIDDLVDEVEAFADVDVWGFSEVETDWVLDLVTAASEGEGADFQQVLGSTGGSDRLLIVYNADELEYIDDFELHRINPRVGGRRRVRSALVARLRYRATGQEFMFMVNHLYRGRSDRRHEQARLLNEWVAEQGQPVIAVGDYNFDWDVVGGDGDHDLGYDRMTADGEFDWVRPEILVKTQKSPSYNSVLDFVFVSRAAKPFARSSTIIVRDGDIPDDERMSDHRPVAATFRFPLSFDGNNPAFESRRAVRPMKWETEPVDSNLDDLDAPQLRTLVRRLQDDIGESKRLAAGQD